MADRDWDKELAKIDKQLSSLSDDQLLGPTPVRLSGAAPGAGVAKTQASSQTKPAGRPAATPDKASKGGFWGRKSSAAAPTAVPSSAATRGDVPGTRTWSVYARLLLSVALGIAMVLWPYPSRCGAGLAAYLAAVVVVVAGGVWSSVWTWRHRASHAHALSLLLILWGLILGSMEVLPRIGYAKPDLAHPSAWACVP